VGRKKLGALLLLVLIGISAAFFIGRPESSAAAPAPAFAEVSLAMRIVVSERKLYVEQGDEVLRTYTVAVGQKGHATPRGRFATRRIIWNPRWVPPEAEWAKNRIPRAPGDPKNPMGRVKVFFKEPDYYIHGTNDEESLGSAVSHGCVRMANGDIIELATMLMEHGGAPVEPGLLQRLINRVRQTKEVRLSNPIPVNVVS
jgi:lipoprotein-anchoring transpeptidase ErfK/SrfK